MKIKPLLFLALLVLPAAALYAEPATVTNHGTVTVRVRYFSAGAQRYEDLGYLKPGETLRVPGGVEKVKITRDYGEWARPLAPGEKLEVVVQEGDQVIGTMTWWGGKVFFDKPTEGSPPPAAASEAPAPAAPETEQTPVTPKTETGTASPGWPWMGGIWNYFFPFSLLLLWLPFFYVWMRRAGRQRYYLGNRWVPRDRLGWGWAWRTESGRCAWVGIILGLIMGFGLAVLAVWGYSSYEAGYDYGFLQFLGRDLYTLPYVLFAGGGAGAMAPWMLVMLFWILTCGFFGVAGGLMPMQWLYTMPFLLAVIPFFFLTRGCAGPEAFALDGGYGGKLLYPPALATGTFSVCLLADYILDWVDPYYMMDPDEADDVHDAVHDFFEGNPWPLLVVLSGGCVTCFYDTAYHLGWDTAIGYFLHQFPAMFFGGMTLPFNLLAILFWMLLFGGLGWTLFRNPARGLFHAAWIPALLVLLFLAMGNYPQRDLSGIRNPYSGLRSRFLIGQRVFATDGGAGGDRTDRGGTDGFGDEFNVGGRSRFGGLGRDTGFDRGGQLQLDDRNQYK